MTVASATCQVVWFGKMLSELKPEQKGPTKILCDDKFVIALTNNALFHGRNKRVSHYIRELMKNDEIKLKLCRS